MNEALTVDICQEAFSVMGQMMSFYGASQSAQKLAFDRSRTDKRHSRPCRRVLRSETGVSQLIATWRREGRYTQADGLPKVLPISGKGATLESLVKKFLPGFAVSEVVKILCAQCGVTTLKGRKVALLGNPVNIMSDAPATTLAWLITQIRHMADTVRFNSTLPANAKGKGRYQRRIYNVIPKKKTAAWRQDVRKLLQETSDRVEDSLEAQVPEVPVKDGRLCGVGIFIFEEEDDDSG